MKMKTVGHQEYENKTNRKRLTIDLKSLSLQFLGKYSCSALGKSLSVTFSLCLKYGANVVKVTWRVLGEKKNNKLTGCKNGQQDSGMVKNEPKSNSTEDELTDVVVFDMTNMKENKLIRAYRRY